MGWILEVAKMFMYISFPVGIFHYVNQPEYFEKYVLKVKQEYYPTQSKKTIEQMEEFIQEVNIKAEKRRLDEMEKQQAQKQ